MEYASLVLAVDSKRASYTGGTASVFSGAKDPIEGNLNTSEEKALTLTARDNIAIAHDIAGRDGGIDEGYLQKVASMLGINDRLDHRPSS